MIARALIASLLLAGCVTAGPTMTDTLSAWRSGRTDVALLQARAEYERFRVGNDLSEEAVMRAAADVRETLATTPIPPRSAPSEDRSPHGRPGVLSGDVRASLLSGRFTETARAITVIAGLELRRHAAALITVVYRRDPMVDDGVLLPDASITLRSVVAKRLALDALEGLPAR